MNTKNETRKREVKYSVIYVDVPWEEQSWSLDSTRDAPIKNWSAQDALLLLWVPNALLPDGLLMVRDWGFDYVGLLTWRKPKDEVNNFLPCCECEYMLICKGGIANASHLLRNMLYEGPADAGGYKPQGFRKILAGAGNYAFGESATYLDVFGQYWQNRFPHYERGRWDFLVDF